MRWSGSATSCLCPAVLPVFPVPIVTWSSLDSKAVSAADGNLVFDSIALSDSGRYKCEATNGIGEPVSKVIQILVNGTSGKSTEPPHVLLSIFSHELILILYDSSPCQIQ